MRPPRHRFPENIVNQVYECALLGLSTREIAKHVGISAGTVHKMLHEFDAADRNYHLLRALAVNLHKNGSNPDEYAREVRINNMLTRVGVSPPDIESLISLLPEYCLKAEIPLDRLIEFLKYFMQFCATYGGNPTYWHQDIEAIDRQLALGDDLLAQRDSEINKKQTQLKELDQELWRILKQVEHAEKYKKSNTRPVGRAKIFSGNGRELKYSDT